MKEIKALVLCSSRFAVPSLQQLLHAGMLAAVAVPAGMDEAAENAEAILQGSGIPVIRLTAVYEKELSELIREKEINLGLMLTFPWKIPESVYSLPAYGFYNFHPGPLPLYRGPDPIFQQIKRKEGYAGIVIHKPDASFDTGPVVMKEKIKILATDTYGMLTTKLAFTAARMLLVLLKMISTEIVPPSLAQNNDAASYYKRQGAEDVKIRWQTMNADEIIALMNACNPWNKGALTAINNMILRIPAAEKIPVEPTVQLPGIIMSFTERGMTVATIENEAILVPFVHMEEGFLSASRLPEFGLCAGVVFQDPK